ncbi:hypothetical protein [Cerasicoccus frondis]|uniref:hypothetical protein n=1 Tax=Cerasicoccus frondis TaxID=490090 RepID=UPI002852ADF3|nr:hypothetical protein [Cerasicoccus frondis]
MNELSGMKRGIRRVFHAGAFSEQGLAIFSDLGWHAAAHVLQPGLNCPHHQYVFR